MTNRIPKTWFLLFPLLLYGLSAGAQNQTNQGEKYSFEFRGEPLEMVLEEVAMQTGINMAYDPELVQDQSVYERIRNKTIPEILKQILNGTPLDYLTLSSGTIVIVETVSGAPAYGSYFGKVVDEETGDPLPGASVMLADASGGTSTSASGNFTINRLISGTHTIIFSYIGYEPVYKTVRIKPNAEVRQQVALEPKPIDFTPIVVTGHIPQMPFNGKNGQTTETGRPLETSGRMQDAIRSLTLFSGVQYGLPMTDLHLQGSQPGEHRIMLDGVPVYNPYSFGKMFSAFSPHAISKVELHKAGYGVPQGSQIAGLVNLQHDIKSADQNNAMFQADPLSLNLRGDFSAPVSHDSSSLDIMAAARSNYWDLYQEPTLQNTLQEWDALDPLVTNLLIDAEEDASAYSPSKHRADVRFYDLHLASQYKIDPYRTLTSSFYGGKNFVSTDLLRQAPQLQDLPEYLYARDEYDWNNLMGQVTYTHLVSSRLDIRSQVSYSSNSFRHRYLLGTSDNPSIPELQNSGGNLGVTASYAFSEFQDAGASGRIPTQRNENSIQHMILKTSGTYSFSPTFNLDGGVQVDMVNTRVDLTDLFYLPTISNQQSTFYSSFLNGNWRAGDYWKFTAGNRLTYASPLNRFYAEPRLSVQYDRPETSIGYWSARLSGGLYRQFVNQYEITNPGPTSLVPSFSVWSHAGSSDLPEAWHLSGSFQLEPSPQTVLNLEWFYKWQPTTYTVSYNNLLRGTALNRSQFNAFAESTDMKSLGAGLRLNQTLAESKVKLMLAYDYNYNRINLDTQFGHAVPAPWSEPHRFQFRSLWRIMPQLSTVVKWQTVLGRTWGFRQAYYNFLFYETSQQVGQYDFSSPEDDKLSPFHQLDLSFIYTPSVKSVDMEVRLDLVNLLDRRNTIDWSLRPTNSGNETEEYTIEERTMPGFSPSLSVQFNF